MFSKARKIVSHISSEHYIRYLKSNGAIIGDHTEFLSPIHTEVDVGRAKYISIGSNCIICSGVSIIAHDYSWKILEEAYGKELPSGGMPVNIGNNVFIGVNTTILGNVEIGDNVIIAAGSTICKSVPSNTVCGGNPAKIIESLDVYYKKREETYVNDAKNNARYIFEHTGKLPTIDDMQNFVVLFLPRTNANIEEYVLKKHRVGGCPGKYANILMSTAQLYPDFHTFLIDSLGADIVNDNMK